MTVGGQTSASAVDSALTNNAIGLRNIMLGINNLNTWINGQGNGLQMLANLGYSTVPTATNPGGVSDAQLAQNMIGYLNTLAGVYFGTVQQGGNGGTGAILFNFNNELSQLWAGQ